MKNFLTLLNALPGTSGEPADAPQLRLRAVSPRTGADLLPGLVDAIDRACGWVLSRQMVSATAVQLQVEAQGRALVDLYASLLGQGLELSRESHLLLAERCSCAHLHRATRRSIVSLSLEVSVPADLSSNGEWVRPVLA